VIRIVGGRHRRRKLFAPPDRKIRPTSDRARQALFDILEHRPPGLRGARVLDLCAGTGALGLEAFSRGAASVVLVDQDRDAVALIRRNVARLGDPMQIEVLRADATRLPLTLGPFELVFLDPPYATGLAATVLDAMPAALLAPGAVVVVEIGAREAVPLPASFILDDERRYGAARFLFLRRT
jgi:16S rRNA (guanine966-N2)-methyltransferase